MITKDMLRGRKRGKGGTVVRLRPPHPVWGSVVIVKDLMNREGYDRPDRVGVGPAHRGIAFGVALSDIEAIVDPSELPERITITDEFVERDGHAVPRIRRVRCGYCERWLSADQTLERQHCPHCGEVVTFGPLDGPDSH